MSSRKGPCDGRPEASSVADWPPPQAAKAAARSRTTVMARTAIQRIRIEDTVISVVSFHVVLELPAVLTPALKRTMVDLADCP